MYSFCESHHCIYQPPDYTLSLYAMLFLSTFATNWASLRFHCTDHELYWGLKHLSELQVTHLVLCDKLPYGFVYSPIPLYATRTYFWSFLRPPHFEYTCMYLSVLSSTHCICHQELICSFYILFQTTCHCFASVSSSNFYKEGTPSSPAFLL